MLLAAEAKQAVCWMLDLMQWVQAGRQSCFTSQNHLCPWLYGCKTSTPAAKSWMRFQAAETRQYLTRPFKLEFLL